MTTMQQFSASVKPTTTTTDDGDVEGPPWCWPASTDDWTWELGPDPDDEDPELGVDGGADHLVNEVYEPTDAERREAAEMFAAMDAEAYLNPPDMSLHELILHSEAFFRSWPTSAGELLADTLAALAERVRGVQASTPSELLDRESILAEDMDVIDVYRANLRQPFSISRLEAQERLRAGWSRQFNVTV